MTALVECSASKLPTRDHETLYELLLFGRGMRLISDGDIVGATPVAREGGSVNDDRDARDAIDNALLNATGRLRHAHPFDCRPSSLNG